VLFFFLRRPSYAVTEKKKAVLLHYSKCIQEETRKINILVYENLTCPQMVPCQETFERVPFTPSHSFLPSSV
jgi:hypothetical protein